MRHTTLLRRQCLSGGDKRLHFIYAIFYAIFCAIFCAIFRRWRATERCVIRFIRLRRQLVGRLAAAVSVIRFM